MNPEVKAKWLAALRSGRYKQGFNKLRPTADSFCCLGVLCDVLGAKWNDCDDEDEHDYSINGETEVLPEHIARRLSLDRDPVVTVNGCSRPLSTLNDGREATAFEEGVIRYTFAQIADLIEEQL